MQSISPFSDIVKFVDFPCKNVDVSKTHGVCLVIHIFLVFLWVRYNFAKSHHCEKCVTDFREEDLFGLPHP